MDTGILNKRHAWTQAWYLSEASPFVRGEHGLLNVILRSDDGSMTDCNVQLDLSGKLLEIVDELEREAIKRIREHLPEEVA